MEDNPLDPWKEYREHVLEGQVFGIILSALCQTLLPLADEDRTRLVARFHTTVQRLLQSYAESAEKQVHPADTQILEGFLHHLSECLELGRNALRPLDQ